MAGSSSDKTRSTAARVRVPLDGIRIYFAESDLIRCRKRCVAPKPDEPHLVHDGDGPNVVL
ncbi:hypothetical protein [Streptomyces sp. NPDC046832]|uniref:hypothetical protein n=1 Tax=Streptomyces sp. NPDC046832 TaxID=3155020 RepID=UPI00340E50DD